MKYHSEKTFVDGIRFDSKKEARRYIVLKMLEDMGEITGLRRQVKFTLITGKRWSDGHKHRDTVYIADFVYTENGVIVVEDVKGFRTDAYRIKRELMKEKYNIEVKET